jgi:hypothetical protein
VKKAMKGEYGCIQEGRQHLPRAGKGWGKSTGYILDKIR